MFPSSGYFRGLNCPFFASGLCDRPNCHFRHVEETSNQPTYTPTVQAKPQSLLSLIGNVGKQLSRTSNVHQANATPQYIPTPISVLEQMKKQKFEENGRFLQRVTLGDVAQIDANYQNDATKPCTSSVVDVDVDDASTLQKSSIGKRKHEEDELGDDASVSSKKIKGNNNSKWNEMESLNKSSIKILDRDVLSKQDSRISNKTKEKSKNVEKIVKKVDCDVASSWKETCSKSLNTKELVENSMKHENKKKESKQETFEKSSDKNAKKKNESTIKDKKIKTPSKDSTEKSDGKKSKICSVEVSIKMSKSSSSKSLNETIESESRKAKLPNKNIDTSKQKTKDSQPSKSKEGSKSSGNDLEKIKMAESRQLEMALFGDTISCPLKYKKEKMDHGEGDGKSTGNLKIGKSIKEKSFAKDGHGSSSALKGKEKNISKESNLMKHSTGKMERRSGTSQGLVGGNKRRNSAGFQGGNRKCFQDESELGAICEDPSDDDDDDGGGGDDDGGGGGDDINEDAVTSRMKECYKIFMNPSYKPQKSVEEKVSKKFPALKSSNSVEEQVMIGKKRTAHASTAPQEIMGRKPKKTVRDHREAMLERFAEAKQKLEVETIMKDQKEIQEREKQINLQTKGSKRVAHVPSKAVLKRPVITYNVNSSAVPINFRLECLNKIIDKCLRIYDSEQDAHTRSLEEEKNLIMDCSGVLIYKSRFVTCMLRLNKETAPGPDSSRTNCDSTQLSVKQMIHGRCIHEGNFTLNRSIKVEPLLTASEMCRRLQAYLLNSDQLKLNGFPYRDPVTKTITAKPNLRYPINRSSDESRKICVRCGKEFLVFGYPKKDECLYHWGHFWKKKVAGSVDQRYDCCGGGCDGRGCQIAEYHVHEDNKAGNLTGFVDTMPCSPRIDDDYGLYALDCEMVYTVAGCELARLTVIDFNMKVVYDKLIKPDTPVVDYNTRFSGIKQEDLAPVKTTLRDVQAVLLTMFSDKTILIGHSLENDLMALKLLHQNVVDTSVVFPHRLGHPYKRALRNLSVDVLKKSIQQNVDGHDSQEDAVTCLELMINKIKEDIKRSLRYSRN